MGSIEDTLSFHIVLAGRAHRNLVAQQLAKAGLYIGQELILLQLWQEEGITQTCLAERVGVDVSTMTKALQRMERYGLITRQVDEKDTRTWHVFLTDQGRSLHSEIDVLWDEVERRTVAGLTAGECVLLSELLQRIEQNLT